MPKLDMIDVMKIARDFSIEAGWSYFKVLNVNWDEEEKIWKLDALTGAYINRKTDFEIDDEAQKVTSYKSESR